MTQELLKTGRHAITALTRPSRPDSEQKLPEGIKAAVIDYDNEATLVSALQGQQYLIITLSVTAPPDTHSKLVQAAAIAGVPYIMPNGYGSDIANESLMRDSLVGVSASRIIAEIEAAGVSAWTAMVCGLWYEYSLVMGPEWFGFDFPMRKLTLYDNGTAKINVSTWEQCGRAVAALLSLKELPEDENDISPTVSGWRNKPLYVSSFRVSQRDMFESWKRVTGGTDADWTVDSEPSDDRFKRGKELLEQGDRRGGALATFVRIFYQNGDGDYETKRGLANGTLKLPQEDLDERTRVAKQLLDEGYPTWVMSRLASRLRPQ